MTRARWCVALAMITAGPVAAQSLLYRPPNLGSTWVSEVGVVQFNFLHRFRVSEAPFNEVQNFPTFTLATGLGRGMAAGWRFGTNSSVGPGKATNNESEWYARWRVVGAEGRPGVAAAVTAAYNQLAESVDGEVAVDYSVGPLTLSGTARGVSNPRGGDEARAALAGGFVVRLTEYIGLSADVGSFVSPTTRAAWSAAVVFLIPNSPHTFSLQAGNSATSTIQGSSFGFNQVIYGFEFTIPLHLKRFSPWFGGRRRPVEPTGAPAAATLEVRSFRFPQDTVYVTAGQTVRWVNADPVEHTVTFVAGGPPSSGNLSSGDAFVARFDRPGTYDYHCTPHPYMRGVVVVR